MIDSQTLLMTFTQEEKDLIVAYDDANAHHNKMITRLELAKLEGNSLERIGEIYMKSYQAECAKGEAYTRLINHFSDWQMEVINLIKPTLRMELDMLDLQASAPPPAEEQAKIRWYQCTDADNYYSMTKEQSWRDDGSKFLQALLAAEERNRYCLVLRNDVEFIVRDGTLIPDGGDDEETQETPQV